MGRRSARHRHTSCGGGDTSSNSTVAWASLCLSRFKFDIYIRPSIIDGGAARRLVMQVEECDGNESDETGGRWNPARF